MNYGTSGSTIFRTEQETIAKPKDYPDPPKPPEARHSLEGVEETILMNKLGTTIKKAWHIMNSYLIFCIISMAIGISIGVKVSQSFYKDKMIECVKLQGMVINDIPYTIIKK